MFLFVLFFIFFFINLRLGKAYKFGTEAVDSKSSIVLENTPVTKQIQTFNFGTNEHQSDSQTFEWKLNQIQRSSVKNVHESLRNEMPSTSSQTYSIETRLEKSVEDDLNKTKQCNVIGSKSENLIETAKASTTIENTSAVGTSSGVGNNSGIGTTAGLKSASSYGSISAFKTISNFGTKSLFGTKPLLSKQIGSNLFESHIVKESSCTTTATRSKISQSTIFGSTSGLTTNSAYYGSGEFSSISRQ